MIWDTSVSILDLHCLGEVTDDREKLHSIPERMRLEDFLLADPATTGTDWQDEGTTLSRRLQAASPLANRNLRPLLRGHAMNADAIRVFQTNSSDRRGDTVSPEGILDMALRGTREQRWDLYELARHDAVTSLFCRQRRRANCRPAAARMTVRFRSRPYPNG